MIKFKQTTMSLLSNLEDWKEKDIQEMRGKIEEALKKFKKVEQHISNVNPCEALTPQYWQLVRGIEILESSLF